MYSSIFSSRSTLRSEGDRSSITKSGQIRLNRFFSSMVSLFQRLLRIHDASGERFAPFGNVNSELESKHSPDPSSSAQFPNRRVMMAFLRPVSGLVGDMMINSPCALISIRKSRLSLQKRKNWSSVRRTDCAFRTRRKAVSVSNAGGRAMSASIADHSFRKALLQLFSRRKSGAATSELIQTDPPPVRLLDAESAGQLV